MGTHAYMLMMVPTTCWATMGRRCTAHLLSIGGQHSTLRHWYTQTQSLARFCIQPCLARRAARPLAAASALAAFWLGYGLLCTPWMPAHKPAQEQKP